MHLHIDADYITYKIGFACQTVCKDTGAIITEPLPHVLATVKRSLQGLTRRLEALGTVESTHIYLTGRNNFRNTIYPEYKANRTAEKPLHYQQIREYLVDHWGAVVVEGMEADDACSLAATSDSDAVIISTDKDLRTVPGWHYNPSKPEEGLQYVTELEALRFFYIQLLTGDTVDNIPGVGAPHPVITRAFKLRKGLKGIGPKSAEKILSHYETEEDFLRVVSRCYKLSGNEHMERNAQLLHMTRELDETGSPVLWTKPVVPSIND